MVNTEKLTCRMAAEALAAYGCRRVVVSPGTRNAPLIMAFARHKELQTFSVVDERSAAFVALGMAEITGEPVVMVCTSGSAVLNYGPALAEAYYHRLPLIAITADRPAEWIDQDDSQTIRQPGALASVVLASYSLKGEADTPTDRWLTNRTLSDALQRATTGRRGPVHINISLTEPLTHTVELPDEHPAEFRRIALTLADPVVAIPQARELAQSLVGKKVLIVGGFNPPEAQLSKALEALGRLPGVAVVCEPLANVFGGNVVTWPDAAIARLTEGERKRAVPDVLITFGGSLVSRPLKEFLRKSEIREHWHIGVNEWLMDTYFHLSRRVEIPAEGFFPRLAGALGHFYRVATQNKNEGLDSFSYLWNRPAYTDGKVSPHPPKWTDLRAIQRLFAFAPLSFPRYNLQLGNGTAVRLAQFCYTGMFHRIDSNRGVSGIDGCVSTAIGAASAYRSQTLLVVGDMSFQYDLGALWSLRMAPGLKIALLHNGGGNIFRVISPTRSLAEREELISCNRPMNVEEICRAFGLKYFRADQHTTDSQMQAFLLGQEAALLDIITDPQESAQAMAYYYKNQSDTNPR